MGSQGIESGSEDRATSDELKGLYRDRTAMVGLRTVLKIVCCAQLIFTFTLPAIFGTQKAIVTQWIINEFGKANLIVACIATCFLLMGGIHYPTMRLAGGFMYAVVVFLIGRLMYPYALYSGILWMAFCPWLGVMLAATGWKRGL